MNSKLVGSGMVSLVILAYIRIETATIAPKKTKLLKEPKSFDKGLLFQ
jgi:hypothetical protein